MTLPSNTALVSDGCALALRASSGAPQRERQADAGASLVPEEYLA